ncbi:hypothetical protein [Nitrospirillum sp. BR 11828]|uniref:hypothetical protein n=1 Tax=Nitrospirillum sp. BR 11828 TaxID=3104325 RepID=UPI002ACA9E8B|nr:hypothetical protein [Nitrospirillum sp. BR 11828]MDZ5645698.1 hypothetical protein [Nitrospirillum sp. BR 11828]
MNALITSISNLGTAAPLPSTRSFLLAVIAAMALLMVTYGLTIALTDNDPRAFAALGTGRYIMLSILALSVLLFLFSAAALTFRTVFHLNGRRILEAAKRNGTPPPWLEAVVAVSFADGLTVLAWLVYIIASPFLLKGLL